MSEMKTFVFDLDGTLCETEGNNYADAVPKKDVVDRVNKLVELGHTVHIFTARGMATYFGDVELARDAYYELTEQWLADNGVKYHKLFFGKPAGDYYVDDKALRPDEFANSDI
jgi:capsule biosynthesis phosphatase